MQHGHEWLNPKDPGHPAMVTLGTMNFGTRTPEADAIHIMRRALERGVDWFDTANVYGNGASEEIIGRFLKTNETMVRLATKVGLGEVAGAPEGLSGAVVQAALEASLKRLQVEHIDLYYLHQPDRSTPIAETILALEQARTAGKIGAWGISNFASWRIDEINHVCASIGAEKPRVSQVIYNLLIRQLDVEYFDFASRGGLHTTIYNPLAAGLLAGKNLDAIEPGGRFDHNQRYLDRYISPRMRELAKSYVALANEIGLEPARLAYSWVVRHPGVDSVLLGPATVAQLDDAIDGSAHALDDETTAKIEAIHRAWLGTDAAYAR